MAFYVYILASRSGTLYVGVTNDLLRRLEQHGSGAGSRFAARHEVERLVHCELFERVRDAIVREKQLKGWRRSKKVALIEAHNPEWEDLRPKL
ncbi:MAG TPA: GIY-YIG nuclease family protein [Thermoanaerobaculia bacterium]|nr:GIY-YIG nuclease family protein [Thermoanaerobaculia bacterium]